MQQQRVALLKEKETAEKVAAQAFAQSYLSDLLPSVFSNLNEGGFFYDPVERGTCTYMYIVYSSCRAAWALQLICWKYSDLCTEVM